MCYALSSSKSSVSPLLRPAVTVWDTNVFPYLLMVVVKPNQNALFKSEQGSYIGGVSTASSLAIGFTYMRGARYLSEGCVFVLLVNNR